MQEKKWLDWLIRLQSLAQAGLAYGKDKYDIERFEEIRDLSVQMLTALSDLPAQKVENLFASETGYQTPKIDTRAAIFKENKILLVQEANGTWALPGGWCDVDQSVKENTIKEVKEEAGLNVVLDKVIAVQDRDKHNQPPYAYKICKIFYNQRASFPKASCLKKRKFYPAHKRDASNARDDASACLRRGLDL